MDYVEPILIDNYALHCQLINGTYNFNRYKLYFEKDKPALKIDEDNGRCPLSATDNFFKYEVRDVFLNG